MSYDLLQYICPPDGKQYRLVGLGDEHCRCVQAADGWVEFRKNRHMEEFYVTDTVIGRGADTSEISADGVHPTGRFYVLYTRQPDGSLTYGAPWAKRRMAVGETYHRDCRVIRYKFDGSVIDEYDDATDLVINAHHPSLFFPNSGITVNDVLELQWGGEEVYYYANGYGLVGWKNLRTEVQSYVGTFDAAIPEPFPHDVKPRPKVAKPSRIADLLPPDVIEVAEKKTFVVVWDDGLWVRQDPSINGTQIGSVGYQDRIRVDADSRVQDDANGIIWWHHHDGVDPNGARISGWSAERWPARGHIYMELAETLARHPIEPAAIRQFIRDADDPFDVNNVEDVPFRDAMFTKLPVDTIHWVQHFGNTEFAFSNAVKYAYCQRLHGGIDLADVAAERDELVPVRAGVFKGRVLGPSSHFGPRNVCVRIDTDKPGCHYVVIYGHLHPEPPLVAEGTQVTPDTVLGHIATTTALKEYESPANSGKFPFKHMSPHLHLEIRLHVDGQDYILNPLLFLPNAFRDALVKMNASFHGWQKWQTPFDQPVLRRGGEPIGPTVLP